MWLKNVNILFHGHMLLVILMVKKLLKNFIKKNCKKLIKKKDDKLYVKWKGYDSSFNSWIVEKDIVK